MSEQPRGSEYLQGVEEKILFPTSNFVESVRAEEEKLDQLHTQLKKDFEDCEPEHRAFKVNEGENRDGYRIVCLQKDDEVISIDALLPSGYRLILSEEGSFRRDGRNKTIEYPSGGLDKKGGLLTLFHEIGHSIDSQFGTDKVSQTAIDLASLQARIRKHFETLKAKNSGKEEIVVSFYEPFNDLVGIEADNLLPDWFKDHVYSKSSLLERRAWCYALLIARHLKTLGFDVLDDFKDFQDIKRFIDLQLSTYEVHREFDKKIYYKDKNGYRPIHTNKHEEYLETE